MERLDPNRPVSARLKADFPGPSGRRNVGKQRPAGSGNETGRSLSLPAQRGQPPHQRERGRGPFSERCLLTPPSSPWTIRDRWITHLVLGFDPADLAGTMPDCPAPRRRPPAGLPPGGPVDRSVRRRFSYQIIWFQQLPFTQVRWRTFPPRTAWKVAFTWTRYTCPGVISLRSLNSGTAGS